MTRIHQSFIPILRTKYSIDVKIYLEQNRELHFDDYFLPNGIIDQPAIIHFYFTICDRVNVKLKWAEQSNTNFGAQFGLKL